MYMESFGQQSFEREIGNIVERYTMQPRTIPVLLWDTYPIGLGR